MLSAEREKIFGLVPAIKTFPKVTALSTAKQSKWDETIADEEFKSLTTQRAQIVYLIDNLCVGDDKQVRFTHTDIANFFGIRRQTVEEHYRKATSGVLDPNRPSLL